MERQFGRERIATFTGLFEHGSRDPMHLSDVTIACAQSCSELANRCADESLASELRSIALRLQSAAIDDAELCDASFQQAIWEPTEG